MRGLTPVVTPASTAPSVVWTGICHACSSVSPWPEASASTAAKSTAAEEESSSSIPTTIGPSLTDQSSGTTTVGVCDRVAVRNGNHPVNADLTASADGRR